MAVHLQYPYKQDMEDQSLFSSMGQTFSGFRIGLSNTYCKSLVLLSHGHSYLPVIFCLCEGCGCASQGMFEADDAKSPKAHQ